MPTKPKSIRRPWQPQRKAQERREGEEIAHPYRFVRDPGNPGRL